MSGGFSPLPPFSAAYVHGISFTVAEITAITVKVFPLESFVVYRSSYMHNNEEVIIQCVLSTLVIQYEKIRLMCNRKFDHFLDLDF